MKVCEESDLSLITTFRDAMEMSKDHAPMEWVVEALHINALDNLAP